MYQSWFNEKIDSESLKSFRFPERVLATEAYPEPTQTSKMEGFAKKVNKFCTLIIFVKHSILDISLCSEYTFGPEIS